MSLTISEDHDCWSCVIQKRVCDRQRPFCSVCIFSEQLCPGYQTISSNYYNYDTTWKFLPTPGSTQLNFYPNSVSHLSANTSIGEFDKMNPCGIGVPIALDDKENSHWQALPFFSRRSESPTLKDIRPDSAYPRVEERNAGNGQGAQDCGHKERIPRHPSAVVGHQTQPRLRDEWSPATSTTLLSDSSSTSSSLEKTTQSDSECIGEAQFGTCILQTDCDLSKYEITKYDKNTSSFSRRCGYPGCKTERDFARACDLRKHITRHQKKFHCRYDRCYQSLSHQNPALPSTKRHVSSTGFSTRKDRSRHEAKHEPLAQCEWGIKQLGKCLRMFSRVDNMRDHVRRVHGEGSTT